MRTFNRGKLRKLVEAGKVTAVETYHYDDMAGAERSRQEMPVAMKPADWKERQQGVCYLDAWDFKTKSGCAYYSHEDRCDLVTLIVHGNSNYKLRIVD